MVRYGLCLWMMVAGVTGGLLLASCDRKEPPRDARHFGIAYESLGQRFQVTGGTADYEEGKVYGSPFVYKNEEAEALEWYRRHRKGRTFDINLDTNEEYDWEPMPSSIILARPGRTKEVPLTNEEQETVRRYLDGEIEIEEALDDVFLRNKEQILRFFEEGKPQ